MKRTIWIIVIATLLFSLLHVHYTDKSLSARTYEVIPDEAIRLRILANSDEEADQRIKYLVRDIVSDQIDDWVGHMSDIDEARNYIESHAQELLGLIKDHLKREKIDQSVQLSYNRKVSFPMKLYDKVLYPAGDYEAILITLGEGSGANWWCVLFPPLCFLDFDKGATIAEEAKEEEGEKIKIKFFLLEWLGLS